MDDVARLLAAIKRQNELSPDSALPELMALIAQNAQTLTGAQAAAVELVEGDELVARAATGAAEELLASRMPVAESLSGLTVRSQAVQRCDQCDTDAGSDRQVAKALGMRSMVTIPLFHRAEVVGVLKVMAKRPAHFSDANVELLQVMAGLVASAISQARRHEDASHAGLHDQLTGLVNRVFLKETLLAAMARWRRHGGSVAVVVVDLDGFRPVNDEHGFAVGDTVLTETARRLRATVRAGDVVARIGGDEFAILCENRDVGSTTHLARRLARQLTMPVQTSAGLVSVGVSIGAAVAVAGESGEQLMSRADAAMYRTKRSRQRGLDVHNVSISGPTPT